MQLSIEPQGAATRLAVPGGPALWYFPYVEVGDAPLPAATAPVAQVRTFRLPEGTLLLRERLEPAGPGLLRIAQEWSYAGLPVSGVKLRTLFSCDPGGELLYYTYMGRVWNGNRFGTPLHRWGEELREDRFSVPACISVESAAGVAGVWASPQASLAEPLTSAALRSGALPAGAALARASGIAPAAHGYHLLISCPHTDCIADRGVYEDVRLSLTAGWQLRKTLYVYLAGAPAGGGDLPQARGRYGEVLRAAWQVLYPTAPTAPRYSLAELGAIKLASLLRPPGTGLLRQKTYGGRAYTLWYVAKHSGDRLHPYAGFSWSGYEAMAAWHVLRHWRATADAAAGGYAVSAVDFFLDNAWAASGLLYPVFFDQVDGPGWGYVGGEKWGTFRTDVGQIDMNPLGEGLYWILRCVALVEEHAAAAPPGWRQGRWRELVRRVCDRIMALWPDGAVPGRVWGESAEPVYPPPAGGGPTSAAYLVWAFLELYRQTGAVAYRRYAAQIGSQVLAFALTHAVYWKSEHDTHCIDKRAGHGALKAFLDLYEATGEERWLGAARRAGHWLASWQWHYNVRFPEETPLGHFDYRTVGGTGISVEYNGLQYAFAPGAYEWCRLWRLTGEVEFVQRARALLHQGTQLLLTRESIDWLNAHYMETPIADADFEGAQVEDIMPTTAAYPPGSDFNLHTQKGDIQIKREPFYSMFGLVMPLDGARVLAEFGSVCYSARWRCGEALDSLDLLTATQAAGHITLCLRNRLPRRQEYRLTLLDLPPGRYRLGETMCSAEELAAGVTVTLEASEERELTIYG